MKLAVSCNLLNMQVAAAAIEAIDVAVAVMELATTSVFASMVSSVLMLCLAVSTVL